MMNLKSDEMCLSVHELGEITSPTDNKDKIEKEREKQERERASHGTCSFLQDDFAPWRHLPHTRQALTG